MFPGLVGGRRPIAGKKNANPKGGGKNLAFCFACGYHVFFLESPSMQRPTNLDPMVSWKPPPCQIYLNPERVLLPLFFRVAKLNNPDHGIGEGEGFIGGYYLCVGMGKLRTN